MIIHTFVEVKNDLRGQVSLDDRLTLTVRLDWFGEGDLFDYISDEEYTQILDDFSWAEDTSVDWIAGKVIRTLGIDPKKTEYNGIETDRSVSVQVYLKNIDRLDYGCIAHKVLEELLEVFNVD